MKSNNPITYDPRRAAEGLVFRELGHRTRYLGQWSWCKPKWLRDNEDNWRRVTEDDLAQFSQQLSLDATVQAAPAQSSTQTSSPKTGVEDPEVGDSCATAAKAPSPPERSGPVAERIAPNDTRNAPGGEDEIWIGSKRYVTADRLASMLGISRRSLNRRCSEGKAPPRIKINKVLFEAPPDFPARNRSGQA
jgi:hypothetical protein